MRYGSFEQLLDGTFDSGKGISLHRPIHYVAPGPRVTAETFQGTPHNLVIKTPKHAHQRECRTIGSQPVEWHLKPDENNPGSEIEEYGHVELNLGSSLTNYSGKIPVPALKESRRGLILNLPVKESSTKHGAWRHRNMDVAHLPNKVPKPARDKARHKPCKPTAGTPRTPIPWA